MIYRSNVKRFALDELIQITLKEFDEDFDELSIEKLKQKLPGTESQKNQLIKECRAALFLKSVFSSDKRNQQLAIKLAKQYINNNPNNNNIVEDKLLSFYIDSRDIPKAESLAEQLLNKTPKRARLMSKYINILTIKGEYKKALDYIKENKHDVRKDIVIFNQEFMLLLKIGDTKGTLQHLKRVDKLFLGIKLEDRQDNLKNLKGYATYLHQLKNKGYEDQDLLFALRRVEKKIIEEKKINKDLIRSGKKRLKEPNYAQYYAKETVSSNNDMSIVNSINEKITTQKENLTQAEMKLELENIKCAPIRFIMDCQIECAYGKKGKDITSKINPFLNTTLELNLEERRIITGTFKAFLNSKDTEFYKHNKWTDLQQRWFEKFLLNHLDDDKDSNKCNVKTQE